MRVAIVGCGQLARMLALAGLPLGFKFSFIVDEEHVVTDCVDGLGTIVHVKDAGSYDQLFELAGFPDVLTVEKEHVDTRLLDAFSHKCDVFPPSKAVAVCKHRLNEKDFLSDLGIPVAPYRYATTQAELSSAVDSLGLPVVIKSVSDGYDGKHQWVIREETDLAAVLSSVDPESSPWLVEKFIPFTEEVSLIGVRGKNGQTAFYPLSHNLHSEGVLVQSIAADADVDRAIVATVESYFEKIVSALDYVGVLAIECFISEEGVLVNELAPRVHNSGHWTQIASMSCQFENHIRAITGLSLGSTQALGAAGMVNLLGTPKPPIHEIGQQSSLHWYNKKPKAKRKLGHVNFLAKNRAELLALMDQFKQGL